jgi:hypothetical protein
VLSAGLLQPVTLNISAAANASAAAPPIPPENRFNSAPPEPLPFLEVIRVTVNTCSEHFSP